MTQAQIRMVHGGIRRDDPDYFAVEVMNEVFGGGFSARLFSNIRSKKGLAYSVGGGIGANFDYPGLFQLSMGTKSGSTAAAIDALYEETSNLVKMPATADELARAKDAILNSFVFRFDTKQEVMAEKMLYEFYGYPPDFLERYRAGIEKVTAEDVARVARAHVHRDKLALLVVGKAQDFDRPLADFGPVATLDVSIPEGTPGAKTATDSTPEGRALLARVAEAMGGSEKLQAVKSVQQKASMKMKTPQGEMSIEAESLLVFPDRQRQQMRTPMGEMTSVVSPEASFVSMPMGTREMPASQRESALKEMRTHPIALAQRASDPAAARPRRRYGEARRRRGPDPRAERRGLRRPVARGPGERPDPAYHVAHDGPGGPARAGVRLLRLADGRRRRVRVQAHDQARRRGRRSHRAHGRQAQPGVRPEAVRQAGRGETVGATLWARATRTCRRSRARRRSRPRTP